MVYFSLQDFAPPNFRCCIWQGRVKLRLNNWNCNNSTKHTGQEKDIMTKRKCAFILTIFLAVIASTGCESSAAEEIKPVVKGAGYTSEDVVSAAKLQEYFDCEGDDPYRNNGELQFSALSSKLLTANGHGWRNELKKKSELRKSMYTTREKLSATVQADLSPGVKTMIVQYHDNAQGTLLKVFLADIQNGKIINGIANDGIFDIYAVFTKPDGSEMVSPLAAYRPGEPVTFSVENREGTITVSVDAVSVTETVKDCEGAYFKFGNYLQAQDAITSV